MFISPRKLCVSDRAPRTTLLALAVLMALGSFHLSVAAQQASEAKATPPRLIHKVEPEYTPEAREAGLEGTVVVSVEVGTDGKAHDSRVTRSLGLGLDEKAIEAVELWTFEPGTRDGEPVAVRATIELNYRLK
jgi:TonB family protein